MGNHGKSSRAARVLRFTLTSALVMAPVSGCGSSTVEPEGPHVNTGPADERYAPNPGPDERAPQPPLAPSQPLGPQPPSASPGPEPTSPIDAGFNGLIIES